MAVVSQERVKTIREAYDHRCAYCGKDLEDASNTLFTKYTIDHIVPRSKGGGNELDNLALACALCNGLKGNLTLEQLSRKLRMRIMAGRNEIRHLEKMLSNIGEVANG